MPMTAADRKREEEFEAREDVRMLSRADEIRGDRRRMTRAQRMAKKDLKSAQRTVRSVTAKRT